MIINRQPEPITHEIDVALNRLGRDLELGRDLLAVREMAGLQGCMKSHHSLQRGPRKIFIIFYHRTVDVLPPVLGSRHEKLQDPLSTPPFARHSILGPARSHRTWPANPARPASFPGGCFPHPASSAKGVRIQRGQARLKW